MGIRRLIKLLNQPYRCKKTIKQRYDAIDSLIKTTNDINISKSLQGFGDIERILTRISIASARPHDLTGLRKALQKIPEIKQYLCKTQSTLLESINANIDTFPKVLTTLEMAIIENPPTLIRDGGVIKTGYNKELDTLRNIDQNGQEFLEELEERT